MLIREEIVKPDGPSSRDARGVSGRDATVTSNQDPIPEGDDPKHGLVSLRSPIGGVLSLAVAIPPMLLCMALLIGVGLDQGLSPAASLLAALLLALLPAIGIASLLRLGGVGMGIAAFGWSILLLSAFPNYFPERREASLEIGTRFIASPLGAGASDFLVGRGQSLLGLLGPEPPAKLRAMPMESLTSDWVLQANGRKPKGSVAALDPPASKPAKVDEHVTVIPYDGEGASMRIPIHVDGPEFGEQYTMIFDTGATLTTLDRSRLEHLDIDLPPDAPVVTLHTAAGELEATLALVDAIWIGDQVVEWVTVAICDTCIEGDAVGLLGLNVSSNFHVSIDHETRQIELRPRSGRRNRRLDIQPWITLGATLKNWTDGRAEIDLAIENRARTEIGSTQLEITCPNDRFMVQIDAIPPNGTTHTTATLPWNSDCNQIQIKPLFSQWQLDRF